MFQSKFSLKIQLTFILAFLAGNSLYPAKVISESLPQPSPNQLVEEVWQIVNQNYVDANFNNHDWNALRSQYLNHIYSSKEQAYSVIREMVAKLGDRYTEFFDPQEFQALDNEIAGNFSGVGLEVAEDQKTKTIIVVAPIQGTPAFQAGILPKDLIVKINNKSTQGMNINDVIRLISGPVKTKVVLTIKRDNQFRNFELTRANIPIHAVSYNTQTIPTGKIGYIRLSEFTGTAAAEMQKIIQTLEKQQVQGYVLDLRSDPGGLVKASLEIANMWLNQELIVSLVNRNQVKDSYTATGHPLTNKPLVVLVNQGSASASEILAGALQDDHRATLVGNRTFGKGLVQVVEPLEDGSAVKLTIAKYYTPKGRDINHIGIAPDIMVALTEAEQKTLAKNQTFGTLSDPQYAKAVDKLSQLINVNIQEITKLKLEKSDH